MSTLLARGDGSSTTYLNTELSAILVGLEASNNLHVEQSGVAFRRLSANRPLLHDVNSTLGRKLLETFSVVYDVTFTYGLRWSSSNVDYSTQGAVSAAGHGGTTVINLASIHASTFFILFPDTYILPSQLVKNTGVFATTAADLKDLAVISPLSLTDDGTTITLASGASDPTYGSVVGGVTLTWGTTNRLIFQGGLAATASGTDTIATLSGDSFDASLYYTKIQTDAAIATALAAGSAPAAVLSLGTHAGINLHLILPYQYGGNTYYFVNISQTGSFNATSDKILGQDLDNLFPPANQDRTSTSSVTISGHLLRMPDAQTLSALITSSPWPEAQWFWTSLSTALDHHQIVEGSSGTIYGSGGNHDSNMRFTVLQVG